MASATNEPTVYDWMEHLDEEHSDRWDQPPADDAQRLKWAQAHMRIAQQLLDEVARRD